MAHDDLTHTSHTFLLSHLVAYLLGRRPSSKAKPERPANIVEAATWADAAAYLAARLHVAPGEVAPVQGWG